MTKFSSRAELLASGAREITTEELDWVSGGGAGDIVNVQLGANFSPTIVVTAPQFNPASFSSGFGSFTFTGGGVGGAGSVPTGITLSLDLSGITFDADIDGDGIPNDQDPVDDTIVVTADPFLVALIKFLDRNITGILASLAAGVGNAAGGNAGGAIAGGGTAVAVEENKDIIIESIVNFFKTDLQILRQPNIYGYNEY